MTVANNLIVAEFDGKPIQFDAVAWFNATHAAKRFGKRPIDWLRLRSTIEYVKTLREVLGISEEITLIRTRRNGGTWMHPDLAVAFARWLNTRFAIWCDMQIKRILRGGATAWSKPPGARSTTTDREGLLSIVAAIVARHRLPFSPVYAALDHFAGVAHARQMTCEQVTDAAEFGARLLAGSATPADFERVASNRARITAPAPQLSLADMAGGAA